MIEPWERQPGEPPRAWAAFCIYRDMDPSFRSLAKVGQTIGKSTRWVEHWSVTFRWVRRVEAWEVEMDRRRRVGQLKAIEEMSKRQIAIALLMEHHGAERLSRMTDADVAQMTILEAIRMIDSGTRLERQARGEPVSAPPPSPATIDRLPIYDYLYRNPSRVGPVMAAVATLRAALSELDPAPPALDAEDDDEDDD